MASLIMKIGDIGLCIAVLVATVFLVEIIKCIIEHVRLKKVTVNKITYKNANNEDVIKEIKLLPNGKEYKKLKSLYQLIAFIFSFVGIFLVLYMYCKMDSLFTIASLSILLAGAEAKAYEIYENLGIRGLFRWIGDKLKSAKTIKDIAKDGEAVNPTELITNAKNEIISLANENKKSKNIIFDKDLVIKSLSSITGQSIEYVATLIDKITTKKVESE